MSVCLCVAVLSGSLLECRANLVIATGNLLKQWQDKLAAHCPSLNVIAIITAPQLDQVTYSHN